MQDPDAPPELDVVMSNRAGLTALKARLADTPRVLEGSDTQPLVDQQLSSLGRWKVWGLTSAGFLAADAVALALSQWKRNRVTAPESA